MCFNTCIYAVNSYYICMDDINMEELKLSETQELYFEQLVEKGWKYDSKMPDGDVFMIKVTSESLETKVIPVQGESYDLPILKFTKQQ